MTRQSETVALAQGRPGTARRLLVHRYGDPAARPKAYLHAAIHADETPGLLVLHHLVRLLDEAAGRGEIAGQIIVVPYANPIGLDQFLNEGHSGRYELAGGGNFNRGWPDLHALIAEDVAERLSDDAAANVAAVRAALLAALEARSPASELEALHLMLARLAADADMVLDLHCDSDSLMHAYLIPAHWPEASDLAAELGCRAVLLADDSGGGAFDECCSTVWTRLARDHPGRPIPAACLAATVELRGRMDVSDDLAAGDARALYRVLQRHGYLAGEPGEPPPACEATPLEACDVLKAPATGVLSYAVELGESVREGDTVAWLIDPAAKDPARGRREIVARNEGLLLARNMFKYVTAGTTIAKVVGSRPLPWRQSGALLES